MVRWNILPSSSRGGKFISENGNIYGRNGNGITYKLFVLFIASCRCGSGHTKDTFKHNKYLIYFRLGYIFCKISRLLMINVIPQ